MMTTASLLQQTSPSADEATAELRYLFVLTARNRGDVLTASSLQPLKRSALGQWDAWRKQWPDAWVPAFTAVPTMAQRFLRDLSTKRSKAAKQLTQAITQSLDAQRDLAGLIALDVYEDHWATYAQQPTQNPFATAAALVFTGWHIVQQADRAFQHEAHGHWAKHGLPEHPAESDPPDAESPQAVFTAQVQAVLSPVAEALRTVFADSHPALDLPEVQLSLFPTPSRDQ